MLEELIRLMDGWMTGGTEGVMEKAIRGRAGKEWPSVCRSVGRSVCLHTLLFVNGPSRLTDWLFVRFRFVSLFSAAACPVAFPLYLSVCLSLCAAGQPLDLLSFPAYLSACVGLSKAIFLYVSLPPSLPPSSPPPLSLSFCRCVCAYKNVYV